MTFRAMLDKQIQCTFIWSMTFDVSKKTRKVLKKTIIGIEGSRAYGKFWKKATPPRLTKIRKIMLLKKFLFEHLLLVNISKVMGQRKLWTPLFLYSFIFEASLNSVLFPLLEYRGLLRYHHKMTISHQCVLQGWESSLSREVMAKA